MGSFFVVLLAGLLLLFPVWAVLKILALEKRNRELETRLDEIERRTTAAREPARAPAPPVLATPRVESISPTRPSEGGAWSPPVRQTGADEAAPSDAANKEIPETQTLPNQRLGDKPLHLEPRRNWEQFTGAKLFAWIGGITAFLGAVFFIKYSFEHDLIPPALRVTLGYGFACALVVAGLLIRRPRYATTAQTLCATGVVCLYAVTFACNSLYAFPWFTPVRTFLLMAAITGLAFVLAVRLTAQVVAILGLLGGFLTPVLLSTGRDNALALFGYIALLDTGLVALALHQRWLFLVPLGAAGTVLLQLGWASKFLSPAKTPTAMVISLGFSVLFLTAYLVSRRLRRHGALTLWPAIALPCVALLFAYAFVGYHAIAAQPALLFGFAFAVDACLLTLAWLDADSPHVHAIGGFMLFGLLATWTGARLTDALLPWALGLYLLHGLIHTTFPLLLQRHRPGARLTGWSQLFPPLALVLMLIPLVKLEHVSFALWPCVLLVDLLALGLALVSRSLMGVASALVLTLAATLVWLLHVSSAQAPESLLLLVIGGFAALFFGGGVLFARRAADLAGKGNSLPSAHVQLPAFSVLAPFFLLVVLTQRLPSAHPSGVLGLGLLLSLLCLSLTVLLTRPPGARQAGVAWLPLCALAGVALLEYTWNARHRLVALGEPAFLWYLALYAVFVVFPFLFRARFLAATGPWATASLVGAVQFPLVYWTVDRVAPNDFMGLVPALFAVAPLASFFLLQRAPVSDPRARLNQLAWFGGVTLLFVTLIVPIQFERQWITLGWALEGTALLWLFRRVPQAGLRGVGLALLVAAFARLACNPAVLEYHARASTPVFNWYLYTYGIVIACLLVGAKLLTAPLAPPASLPEARVFGLRIPPLLNALGIVLAFLLLNLEIADYFSAPGTRVLTFQFSGNFARDMSYTIAWSVFALGLLLVSIWKSTRAGRFAALGLLGVAVLKLFLHDLARLGALHRIGALFGVAIVAIVASLAYQRWVPGEKSSRESKAEG